MSKELTVAANNPQKLNQMFGFSGRPKPAIPVLRVNGSDDEEGTKAPKGTFVLDDGEKVLYAKEVTIRSFVRGYQYRLYDKDDKNKNDMSIIANNFNVEFRSASGRIACGKMQKKKYLALGANVTAEQKYFQEKVKCKLLVFGLVSGEFTDLDTKKKVQVEDALFSWSVSQSSFMTIDGTITGIDKERRPVPLTPIKLMLKKEVNGEVTFYNAIPFVETKAVVLVPDRDQGYLTKIKDFVKENNDHVEEKYEQAHKGAVENNNFAKAGEVVEGKSKVVKSTDMPNDPLDL